MQRYKKLYWRRGRAIDVFKELWYFFNKIRVFCSAVPSNSDRGAVVKTLILGSTLVGCLLFSFSFTAVAADVQTQAAQTSPVPQYEIPAQLTPEERSWFITFQEGNFLSEGWQSISAEIMSKTPPERQPAQKIALENLGKKIGMEWCRPNAVRRVNSSMLKEWGDILRTTARKNPRELASAIAFIDQEVDSVLD